MSINNPEAKIFNGCDEYPIGWQQDYGIFKPMPEPREELSFESFKLFGLVPDIQVYGTPRSSSWEKVRNDWIRLNGTCAVCSCKHDLQVHHIKPFVSHPELELETTNLITLCQPHHLLVGHLMNWHSYNPNVVEDADLWHQKILKRRE